MVPEHFSILQGELSFLTNKCKTKNKPSLLVTPRFVLVPPSAPVSKKNVWWHSADGYMTLYESNQVSSIFMGPVIS